MAKRAEEGGSAEGEGARRQMEEGSHQEAADHCQLVLVDS